LYWLHHYRYRGTKIGIDYITTVPEEFIKKILSVTSLPLLRQQKNISFTSLPFLRQNKKCIGYIVTVTESAAATEAAVKEAAASGTAAMRMGRSKVAEAM
jgi:hypothetical protein